MLFKILLSGLGLLSAGANFVSASPVSDISFQSDSTSDAWFATVSENRRDDDKDRRREQTVADVIKKNDRLRRFDEVLRESGRRISDDLENRDRKFTVFAPTNDAFKDLEDELDRERRRRRRRDDRDDRDDRNENKGDRNHDRDRKDFEEIIRYHIVPDEEYNVEDLFDGQLLDTRLKLDSLRGERERIRVFKFHRNNVYLNLYARIIDEDLEAENGVVHIIDRVLRVPLDVEDTLAVVPTEFSTTYVAAERSELLNDLRDKKAITVLVPNNAAWKNLGIRNLYYLFSEEGRDDLNKIIRYHVGRELAYTPEIIQEGKIRIRTLHRDEEVEIDARRRRGEKGDLDEDRNRRRRDDDDDKNRRRRDDDDKNRRRRRRRGDNDDDRENAPANWIFSVNKGESSIVMTDVIAENGVVQVINNVLIPKDVNLPSALE